MKIDKTDAVAGFPMMEELTVKEIRSYLERSQSILLPVGITEQHG